MGRDKASVLLGGKPLIAHVYEAAKRVFTDIMVVSSLHGAACGLNARVVKDVLPLPGSLTGVVSALLATDAEYVFVLGCDMPFVSAEGMRYVVAAAQGEDVIIPQTEGGLEPMHALYRRSCISPFLAGLGRGHMKIDRLLSLLTTRVLPPDPVFFNRGVSVFTNINTEEDLRRAEKLVQRGGDRPDAGGRPRRGG
jgi:molybdopterin-guanine dinucleotide biosynthesis protein A